MKYHQQGVILLITLLLLGVISALIVAQLEMVLLHQKISHQLAIRQQNRNNIEQSAFQVIASLSHQGQSHCIMTAYPDPNRVIAQLKAKQACTLIQEKSNYNYLIEDLGVEPCLQTLVNHVPRSTRHWRLTLMPEESNQGYLQIRIAELTDYYFCPKSQVMQIKPGIVSWRLWI